MQRYPEGLRSTEAQRASDTRVLQRLLETEAEAEERRASAARRARKYRKRIRDEKAEETAILRTDLANCGLKDNHACRFCDSLHLKISHSVIREGSPESAEELNQETEEHSSKICDFPGCGKLVNCKEDLESHRITHRTMSMRTKPFQCPSCQRKFSIRSLFEDHSASHTGGTAKTEDVTFKEPDESYILPDKLETDQRELVVPKTEPPDEAEELPDVELGILQPKVELEEEPEKEVILDVSATSSGCESEGPTPLKRRNYDLKFKLEVVAYAEKHSKSMAARDKNVHRKQVQEWTKQKKHLEHQLMTTPSSSAAPSKRLQGAGRPVKDTELDEKLVRWVRQQSQKKPRGVSRTTIQKQARAFSTGEDFKASNGWLENFLNRHNLVSRRKEPKECAEKIIENSGTVDYE